MTTRTSAPLGAPCWADLWTSDVKGSQKFYSELLGWEAGEADPQFGGYFQFMRDGVPVAGGMGDMVEAAANNTWKIYLATDDIGKTAAAAEEAGAEITVRPMPVGDLGIQTVLHDPSGADLGAWQAGTFPGFTVINEPGAPSWFELHTRDHAAAVSFYTSVFHWETTSVSDTDEFRYTVMRDPAGEGELAGIMDSSGFLPEGAASFWTLYWEVEDASASVAEVKALGGSVISDAQDTPYGRIATVADPSGAQFRLRTGPR
jgi:hypothetical protein